VLKNYFPGSAASLDLARADSLATIPNGQAKDDGIAIGVAAANALIAERANDGSAPPSGAHDITLSHPVIPDVILHYTKLSQITNDIDDARVYGGIHFRFDQVAGARQGRRIGSYIFKNNLHRCSHNDEDCGDDN
jgi:hypothetical protein